MNQTNSTFTCDFRFDFIENIPLSVVFGMCFVFGLPMIFTSYRFFRMSLFLQSFSLLSSITYLVLLEISTLPIWMNACISASSGFIIGFVGAFVHTIGLLCSSLIQSIFFSTSILFVVHIFYTLSNVFVAPSLILGLFLFLSVFVFKWPRCTSIIYFTSFGVVLWMLSADFFLDLSILRYTALENLLVLPRTRQCWFSWIIFGLWPFFMLLGLLVQFLKTAKGYDYCEGKLFFSSKKSERHLRLLSNKSDIIAKAWVQTSSLPREADLSFHSPYDDDVFYKDDTTSV